MAGRRGRRAAVVALVGAALVLSSCTSGGAGEQPPAAGAAPEPTTSAPATDGAEGLDGEGTTGPEDSQVVQTRELPVDGGTLGVGLHPLVRVDGPPDVGELVVLTLDLSVAELPEGADEIRPGLVFTDPDSSAESRRGSAGAIRLLDLRGGRAHLLATDAQGQALSTPQGAGASGWWRVEPGRPARLQLLFAAPPEDVDDLAVLVPRTGLVDALPVVDGTVPSPMAPSAPPGDQTSGAGPPSQDPLHEGLDTGAVAVAATPALEVYTEEVDDALRTEATTEATEVALAADVLFAFDSADLAPEAQQALAAAADAVRTREPGPVAVVGHTDDQGPEDYNLDLSRRRAQSVADALGPLLGPEYPLTVEGRGQVEPAQPGTSEEARARNRRVELSLGTPLRGGPVAVSTAELPPPPELVAPADEGVVVPSVSGWSFTYRLAEARRLHDHVVVELEVEALPVPGDPGRSMSSLDLGTFRDPRDFSVTDGADSARGTVVLQGSTAVFPLFTRVGEGASPRMCACALNIGVPVAQGQVQTAVVVYPDLPEGGLVLQNTPVTSADVGFRLTGVEVG